MNQDLIFSVADLLVKTFTNTNDAERRLAEVQLSDMAQNDEIYLQIMLSIITINHPSITTQVKNSAAVQIKKLVKTNDEERKLQSKYLFYIQNILAGLTSPNLVIQLRASLGYALTPIFSHENEEVVAYIFPLIFSNLNGNDDAILGSLRALRSVYNDVVHVPALLVYFRHLLDPMLSIVQRVTLGLRNGESNQDSADILSEICGFLTVVIEHFEITSRSSLAEIVQIQSFSALISEILTFVPSETPFGQTCLVSTLKHPLHIKLNQGKAQLLQGMNVVLQFISEHKELESQDTPFIHMIGGLIENLTRSLLLVVGRDEYEGYLSDNYIEEFFLETLILLSKLAQHNRFLAFFIQNSKGIIVEIIFSIIKAFSDDYETIETYPEEFVNSSLEICERQQSATYKTSAVELLQVLCQRIDGMLSFLVSFIYQVLYSTLSRTSQESFNYLTEFQTSKILNSNEIEKVEVCLLVLCCVSDAIISRKDLFVMIELLFRNFLGGIILANSSMIQHRLCLVIRYYLAFLFIGEKVKFTELVEFLLNNCNPNGKSKAVVQQAAETLVRVLEDEECMDRIEPLLETILNSLIGLIPFQNNKSFFESIQELLAQNITLVFPHLSSLISLLVQKIQSEISRLNDKAQKGKNKKSSIIMIKCWNIIRYIADVTATSPEQVSQIETQLLPLFEYMKDPSKIEFDEDILLFEVSLMKKTQKVSDAGWIIFNLLHLVQEKYENTFMQTFEILNCFLFYGKEILAPNLPMIETVIEMAQKCIFAKYQKRNSERENSEAALIFQQILQTFQGLVDNYLTIILSCTLQRLNTAIKHDYFRTRLLGVILSAFAYNTELTISILLNMQSQMGDSSLDNTLKQIFINVQNFKQTYDKKIAIQGLCYLLVYQNLPDNMVISYSHLFKILIQILSDDKSNLSKMAVEPAKQLKKLRTEETEANLVYRNMKTPLEEFDEFTHFREAIRLIQSSNPLKFPSLVGQLDQQQAEQLQTIIKSKRVVISSHKNPMTTTRAIVRPKYKK